MFSMINSMWLGAVEISRVLSRLVVVSIILGVSAPAGAANFPLELVSPRAAGTVPSADAGTPPMPSGHRIFKAYPGVEYNIRAVVIGGAYPFRFSLSNAPAGMTIDSDTGEIIWPNPQANSTPTITVTDAEGTQRSSPWTITVTTAGFVFLDAVNGNDNNDGTISAPWKTLLKLHNSSREGQAVYFKDGTYNLNGIPITGGNGWERTDWGGRAGIWMAYPRHSPLIDQTTTGPGGVLIRMSPDNPPLYVDGLRHNFRNIAWQTGLSHYLVFRRLEFNGPLGGIPEGNPGGVMFIDSMPAHKQYVAFQDIWGHNATNGGSIKTYSLKKWLVEDSIFENGASGFDIKGDIQRYEIRGCIFRNLTRSGIEGNYAGTTTTGEMRYNLFNLPNLLPFDTARGALLMGHAPAYYYRNTIIGTLVDGNDGSGETFYLYRNVIVNSFPAPEKRARTWWTSGYAPLDLDGPNNEGTNLTGYPADGVVDGNGNLTMAYSAYLGTHGYQIANRSTDPAPTPPENLRVE